LYSIDANFCKTLEFIRTARLLNFCRPDSAAAAGAKTSAEADVQWKNALQWSHGACTRATTRAAHFDIAVKLKDWTYDTAIHNAVAAGEYLASRIKEHVRSVSRKYYVRAKVSESVGGRVAMYIVDEGSETKGPSTLHLKKMSSRIVNYGKPKTVKENFDFLG